MASAIVATGTTITFLSPAFTANVISVGMSRTRGSIDATHLGSTGGMEFIAAKLTDGEVSMEISFDPRKSIPLTLDATTITITYPLLVSGSSPQGSHAFPGFVTAADITSSTEEKTTASITVKIAGTVVEVLEPTA